MRGEQYEGLRHWFDAYVQSFRAIPGFRSWVDLKDSHTRRVEEIAGRLGKSLDLPEEDLYLAGAIALLHDVGRFVQIRLYGTFNDRCSENHAALGTRVLQETGVLDGLPPGEAALILTAVGLHNLRRLPGDLAPRPALFARLVQDADKLDILELFTRYYDGEEGLPGEVLDSHLPDTPGFSAALVEDVRHGRLGSYEDVQNRNDRKILHLSWVYGIHFPYTLAEVGRKGYLDRIAASLPSTPVVREIHRAVAEYVARAGGPERAQGARGRHRRETCGRFGPP